MNGRRGGRGSGRTKPLAPLCPYCGNTSALVGGDVIHPRRGDLWGKWFYYCDTCGAYVGCHPASKRPLGVPANAETREARRLLHDQKIDPIWRNAERSGEYDPEDAKAIVIIRQAARKRVYEFIGVKLGLDRDQTHGGMFDIETCRRAWRLLSGISYSEIRMWAKDRKERLTNEQARNAGGAEVRCDGGVDEGATRNPEQDRGAGA